MILLYPIGLPLLFFAVVSRYSRVTCSSSHFLFLNAESEPTIATNSLKLSIKSGSCISLSNRKSGVSIRWRFSLNSLFQLRWWELVDSGLFILLTEFDIELQRTN